MGASETAAVVASARAAGRLERRRPVPAARYPITVEVEYGNRLAALMRAIGARYKPLLEQMPRLLAGAAQVFEVRTDEARARRMGLPLVIENPVGSIRRWRDTDGTEGQTLMRYSYGYLVGAIGADGDDVDVYLGPVDEPELVFVVHQRRKGARDAEAWPEPDEDKVMLGWDSADAAMAAYLAQYDDPRFFGGMSVFTRDGFLALLQERGYEPTSTADIGRIAHADAMEDSTARLLLEEAYALSQRDLRAEGVEALAKLAGERTSQAQRRELAKQIKAGLGIEVEIDERRTRDVLQFFAAENVTAIGNVPEEMHADVANLTMRALSKRMKPETYAEELQKILDVGVTRARQIARDQIGTLNGQLTEIRQLELGITHYFWEDRGDAKVRPTHRARRGQRFPWSRAPAGGHPGHDHGCRCTAKPDLSGVLERERARALPQRAADIENEDLVRTVPARDIMAHGYYEPIAGLDFVKLEKARRSIREGQRDPVKIVVGPNGRYELTDGRHRLRAAIEAGADVRVQFQRGTEHAGMSGGLLHRKW